MGLGCLVEAGLFGDNILHRRSPDLQTFSPLFVVYRNPLHSGLFRFARGSCQQEMTILRLDIRPDEKRAGPQGTAIFLSVSI